VPEARAAFREVGRLLKGRRFGVRIGRPPSSVKLLDSVPANLTVVVVGDEVRPGRGTSGDSPVRPLRARGSDDSGRSEGSHPTRVRRSDPRRERGRGGRLGRILLHLPPGGPRRIGDDPCLGAGGDRPERGGGLRGSRRHRRRAGWKRFCLPRSRPSRRRFVNGSPRGLAWSRRWSGRVKARPLRCFAPPASDLLKRLKDGEATDVETGSARSSHSSDGGRVRAWPVGQDAALAAELARRYVTVGGIVQAVEKGD